MNSWILIQILMNLILMASVVTLWIRLNRPTKDDPRLSKGLQLLQSKISILEDLSDRTDVQVQQLTALLENKCKEIQEKIQAADLHLYKIDQSLKKSLEVTEIFQDRIPHQEIIERQNTIKYVKAAKMAYDGKSVDEIASAVNLSRGEIELIAKVNKEQLMFAEESLPTWAIPSTEETAMGWNDQFVQQIPREIPQNFENVFDSNSNEQTALQKLGEKIREQVPANIPSSPVIPLSQTETVIQNGKTLHVKPFEFRKIDLNGNLS